MNYFTSYRTPLIISLIFIATSSFAQDQKKVRFSKFKIEINNNQQAAEELIEDVIVDFEPKVITLFSNDDLRYQVELLFKRKGNRIKVRRDSEIVLSDGTVLKGNRKKEVQFMSSSAPGEFEFPVADNIVLNKEQYATFFISYRINVSYN